ncbi:hypothetical protein CFP56_006001 [Quercus suber]|uniref:Uncharacterized protein n=1 Tax=Quercus suber TaxID=58331 RepID=A0AAW0M7S4_QUESU
MESILHMLRDCPQVRVFWGVIFPFVVWSLWLRQNKVIFRDHTTLKPIMAKTLAKVSEFAYLGLNQRLKRTTHFIQVRWLPPPEN